jgi:hypothetical protein
LAFKSSILETVTKEALDVRTYWANLEYYDRVSVQMQKASDENDIKTVYECLSRLGGKAKRTGPSKQSLQRSPGVPELDSLKELNLFGAHCERTMGATSAAAPNSAISRFVETGHISLTLPDVHISLNSPMQVYSTEVRRSILKGRMGRATKTNDVPLEVWRGLGAEAAEELAEGINLLHLFGLPVDWTKNPSHGF